MGWRPIEARRPRGRPQRCLSVLRPNHHNLIRGTCHLDLFGLRQVYLCFVERPYTHPRFRVVAFYRLVRHPLYTGFILAFWFTPHMTIGHMVFGAGMTAYILIAVRYEERDLVAVLGERYRRYRDAVPMLVPWPGATHEKVGGDETAPSGMR